MLDFAEKRARTSRATLCPMRVRVAAMLAFGVGCGSNVSMGDGDSSGSAAGGAAPSSSAVNVVSSSTGGAVPCVPGSVESCYEGPSGTLGVGMCAPGTQVCDAEGSFGPCLDQVLPGLEDCGTTDDESCDGNGACTGDALWTFGSNEFVVADAYSVAVDPANDVVVAGTYASGDLVFGGTTLMYMGVSDAFVAKFSSSGNPLWARSFGDTSTAKAMSSSPATSRTPSTSVAEA